MRERLGFVDLLLIAEAIVGEPAERLHRAVSLWRVESALSAPFVSVGGIDLYPDPVERAAICCSRLVRNRPFSHGNAQIAYFCMREMLDRAEVPWPSSQTASIEIADAIKRVEAGTWSEERFVSLVRARVR
jgi:prophage maintenance system killer protein